jgi:hypothetical protein
MRLVGMLVDPATTKVSETIEFDGIENINEIKICSSKTNVLIASGSGKHLTAHIYNGGDWESPRVLPLGEILLGPVKEPYNEKTALCHDFEGVNDIFLSNKSYIFVLAFPFVFVRYSLKSGKAKSFSLLENKALTHKIANAYKTNISKGRIYMSFKQDMVAISAVKRIGARYMQMIAVWQLKPA